MSPPGAVVSAYHREFHRLQERAAAIRAVAEECDAETVNTVLGALRAGLTWTEIGQGFGVTRQGAHAKYARAVTAARRAQAQVRVETVRAAMDPDRDGTR